MERRDKRCVFWLLFGLLAVTTSSVMAQSADLNSARRALLIGDIESAESILGPLAEAGNADACYQHALLLEKVGREAIDSLTCAAKGGNTEAQYRLGLRLRHRGDSVEARRWFELAANENHSGALKQLNMEPGTLDAERQLIKALQEGDANSVDDIVATSGLPVRADPQSPTWIELAAVTGEPGLVAPILAAGANIDTREPSGDTLLIASIRRDQSAFTMWLINKGAELSLTDSAGYSPLHLSLALKRRATAETLINRLPREALDAPDPDGRTPIEIAGLVGLDTLVALLESKGIQSRERALAGRETADSIYHQWPPLVVAAWRGKEDELKRLLTTGSELEVRDSEGYTALGRAVMAGHVGSLELLLAAGADSAATQGVDDLSPLVLAVTSHQRSTLTGLLAAGVDPQLERSDADSPLMRALALHDEPAAMELLGAKPAARLPQTTFLASVDARMPSVSALVFDRCDGCRGREVIDAALLGAVSAGDVQTLEMLLEQHADPNVISDDGTPCIALAASTSPAIAVQLLLNQGADPEATNRHGNTALAIAAAKDRSTVLSVLLRADADLEVRNEDGMTPLMLAAQAGGEVSVKLLLHAGAKPSRRDPRRRMAKDYARLAGHETVAQILESADS